MSAELIALSNALAQATDRAAVREQRLRRARVAG